MPMSRMNGTETGAPPDDMEVKQMRNKKMLAIALAVVFGLAFGRKNPALGISLGLCMGAAFGLFSNEREEEKAEAEASTADRDSAFPVRPLEKSETGAALQLAWKVFCEYESPDYSPEGTEEFRKALNDDEYLRGLVYYGAFDGDRLIGMLAIRKEKAHICLCFVDGAYHRQGVGTALFRRMRKDFPGRTITVNSSPFGVPFYRALGFTQTDSEQTINGIRFTPMVYKA